MKDRAIEMCNQNNHRIYFVDGFYFAPYFCQIEIIANWIFWSSGKLLSISAKLKRPNMSKSLMQLYMVAFYRGIFQLPYVKGM